MKRRVFLARGAAGVLGAAFAGSAACADGFQTAVVAQLRSQGYREINVERTMLGRVRIVGAKGSGSREIILNPRTGEILRDVVLAEDGRVAPQIAGGDGSGKAGSGDEGAEESGDSVGNDSDGDDSDDGDSQGNDSGKGGSRGQGHGHDKR